ncbi:MAG: metallophosphoesterase [Promethearchaeota archaeon]
MDPEQRLAYIIERITTMTRSDLKIMLRGVVSILSNEPVLVQVTEGPVVFVGDLHGDLEAATRAYLYFLKGGHKRLVFLGDYIDRGGKQVDCVNFLLYIKLLHRFKVFLLRGNHEVEAVNRGYGFHDSVKSRFGRESMEVYGLYNAAFNQLPLAGQTWNGIFFAHAGIPEELEAITDLTRETLGSGEHGEFARELLWNDPSENRNGFKNNWGRGPGTKVYGRDVFDDFLARNNLKGMIRGHGHCGGGCEEYFDGKLVSLFSSRAFSKRHRPKIGILSRDGKLEVIDF